MLMSRRTRLMILRAATLTVALAAADFSPPPAVAAPAAPNLTIIGSAPDEPGLARDGDLRAGAATVEITPPRSTWEVMMGGYFNPQQTPQGVHDPLYAKALVLDNGQTRLCIVTTDLLSVPINLRNAALAKLSPGAGLAPERVLMCASHTHSGPGGITEMKFAAQFLGEFRPDLAQFIADRIARAIEQAAQDLRPAKWGYASDKVWGFTHNRRGNELIDPGVAVLRIDGADDKPIALLVNFGTHPVFLDEDNRLFSADFVGYMLKAIEEARGGIALFANGAQGDQNPDQDETIAGAYARAQAYGKRMAAEALRIGATAPMRRQVALASLLAELQLPAPTVEIGTQRVPLMALRLSDVLLLGVPGEPSAEIGLSIEAEARQFGFDLPIVIGLANDEIAYILSRDDYERGGYEAQMSFFGAGLGELMVQAMSDLARRIQPRAQALTRVPVRAAAGSGAAR